MNVPVCITEQMPVESQAQLGVETQEHRLRNFISKAAICLGGLALGAGIGAVVGVKTDTSTTIAGNEATAELHFGNNNVDLGIIGAHIPSKSSALGLPVGANIRLDASQSYSPGKTPDDKILPEILQTFSDIDHETEKITSDIKWHIARDTRNGALGGLVTVGGLMLLAGVGKHAWNNLEEDSRQDFRKNFGPILRRTKYSIGSVAAISAFTACGIVANSYTTAPKEGPSIIANPTFNGTALEGSEIVGLAAPLVDSAVPLVKKYVTETDAFYKKVSGNFDVAYEKYVKSNTIPVGENIAPILLVSDRHCNTGMDRVLTTAAKKFRAQIIAPAGDDNFWGSFSFEKACTSGLAERAKSIHAKFVVTIGNHDPHRGDQSTYIQGIKIINGAQTTVNTSNGKVTFLSSQDPRRSEFGHEISPYSPEAQATALVKQGLELGKLACDSPSSTDILITHDTRAASVALQNGCGKINFAFSGHSHHRKLPELTNYIYRYTEGSTGGAAPELPSVGPLGSDATFSILYFNTQTHQPESMIYFTVHTDKTVDISPVDQLNDNSAAQTQGSVVDNG